MKACLILLPYKKAKKHQQPASNYPTNFQWHPIHGVWCYSSTAQFQSVSSKWAFIQPAILFVVWVQKGLFSLPSHTYVQIQHQDALQGFGGDSFWQSAAYAAPVIFLAWPEFSHSCACALLFPDHCPYSWNWVQTSERCFCSLPLNHSTDNLCFQIFWELLWESSSVSVQCQREAQLESFHLKYIFLWLDLLAYEVQGLTS